GADRRVEKGAILEAMVTSPEPHEGFLDHIFRVGLGAHPLPGEQEQTGGELRKTDLPLFIDCQMLHDLFTVFYIRDAANSSFCLNLAEILASNGATPEPRMDTDR